jgi:hypothetical protein
MFEENMLTSSDQAVAFINWHGLVTLFPVKGVVSPS